MYLLDLMCFSIELFFKERVSLHTLQRFPLTTAKYSLGYSFKRSQALVALVARVPLPLPLYLPSLTWIFRLREIEEFFGTLKFAPLFVATNIGSFTSVS